MSKQVCLSVVVSAFVLGLTNGCATTSSSDCRLQSKQVCESQSYREALDAIMESDQLYRDPISWGTTDPDELARLNALDDEAHMAEYARRNAEGISLDPEIEEEYWKKQNAIDEVNTKKLMKLIDQHGWPTEETAGEGFPSPVPILIHVKMEDMNWVLPKLREEVLAGRMDPGPYAMIYDRKQQHNGEPQIYGKMQAFDSKTMTVLPPAIVDIDATNRARAEIGMEPLLEYRITDRQTAAGPMKARSKD